MSAGVDGIEVAEAVARAHAGGRGALSAGGDRHPRRPHDLPETRGLPCSRTDNRRRANPRWLGGQGAFTLVLHTWTQDLRLHVHAHALIACGALGADGQWLAPKRSSRFLFPVHALSKVFAGKFRDALRAAERGGLLTRDPEQGARRQQRMRRLRDKPWVVYAKTPLAGPAAVLEDLSRYTHRTAVSDERIVAIAGEQVLLRVRADPGTGRKTVRIDGVQFIGRFLQHVLPPGFKRIRHYGVLASAHKACCLAAARQALQMPAPSALARETAAQFMRRVARIDIESCPLPRAMACRAGEARRPDRGADDTAIAAASRRCGGCAARAMNGVRVMSIQAPAAGHGLVPGRWVPLRVRRPDVSCPHARQRRTPASSSTLRMVAGVVHARRPARALPRG